jgi:hypothetical protein
MCRSGAAAAFVELDRGTGPVVESEGLRLVLVIGGVNGTTPVAELVVYIVETLKNDPAPPRRGPRSIRGLIVVLEDGDAGAPPPKSGPSPILTSKSGALFDINNDGAGVFEAAFGLTPDTNLEGEEAGVGERLVEAGIGPVWVEPPRSDPRSGLRSTFTLIIGPVLAVDTTLVLGEIKALEA